PEVIEVLVGVLLDDPHAAVRYGVATALGRIRYKSTFFPLMAALADPFPEVAAAAAWAMGKLADPRGIEPLRNGCVNKELEPKVRAACARALGTMRARAAQKELATALKDDDFEVRCEAAEALGLIGNRTAAPHLALSACDEISDVRQAATYALIRIGPDAVPAIQAMLWREQELIASGHKLRLGIRQLEKALATIQRKAGPG
ncbi:MAG: HEAT repeat domain-containing protein, partial [Proteobacteria bacterium]|nr:HEAT repeat domain-containing protein [Pseudomonadota bacterium]